MLFYGSDYPRMLEDLVNGDIDACFLPSGWIEETVPALLPRVRVLAPANRSYQGEPYPFPVTTPLAPHYGLAAAPHVPWRLRQRVYDALNQLNASEPAAAAAGAALFALPGDYGPARDLAISVQRARAHTHTGSAGSRTPFIKKTRTCRLPRLPQ